MNHLRLLRLLFVVLALFAVSASVSAQDKPFDGVTVNILISACPQVTEPLLRRGPDFEELTGANIEVTTLPFAELYNGVRGSQWWNLSVLVLLMVIPLLAMAVALERYIAKGLLVGAVKG